MKRLARMSVLGLTIAAMLVGAGLAYAQNFADDAALISIKATIFSGRGKAAKLNKQVFVLPDGALGSPGPARRVPLVIPFWAGLAIDPESGELLPRWIKKCTMKLSGGLNGSTNCDAAEDLSPDIPPEARGVFVAFMDVPQPVNREAQAELNFKGGKKSPAGTILTQVMGFVNLDIAVDRAHTRELITQMAIERALTEVERIRAELRGE